MTTYYLIPLLIPRFDLHGLTSTLIALLYVLQVGGMTVLESTPLLRQHMCPPLWGHFIFSVIIGVFWDVWHCWAIYEHVIIWIIVVCFIIRRISGIRAIILGDVWMCANIGLLPLFTIIRIILEPVLMFDER